MSPLGSPAPTDGPQHVAQPATAARHLATGALRVTLAMGLAVSGATAVAVSLSGALPPADPRALLASLTDAELRVATLLADGLAAKQIAVELAVGLSTVRTHIASAKRKTGARTLEQLAGIVAQRGPRP
jgi:DNA-binding CsgD family transcriptional regulator